MALLTNINGKFSVSDAGAVTFNNAFTFPTTDGTANYVLKTNGSGQLAWAADNYENYDYWTLQGDSAANVNINSTNTLKFVGGTYIDTSATWAGGSNPRKLTINHETTSRTDTTSTDAPAFGGTFEAVTSVTTNTTGHVTAIDVSTITIPTDPGGTVKGTGTATRVAFWSASDTITSDADLYWDNTNKRLGIGTALPTTALTIRKAISPTDYGEQASMIEFKSYYTGYDTETVKSAIYSGVSSQTTLQTTRGFMSFWTADFVSGGGQSLTEKMRIESNGNVGIGTDSPGAKLDIKSSLTAIGTEQLLTIGHDINWNLKLQENWNASGIQFDILQKYGTGAAANVLTFFNGKVGIGTTGPAAKLFVDGKDASNNSSLMTKLDTAYAMGISNEWVSTYVSKLQLGRVGIGSISNIDFIYDIAGTEYGSIKRNYTASSLKFERGTTVDMIINGSGNVGIGATSPTSKLHLRDPGVNSDVGIKIGNDSRDWNLKVMGSISDSFQIFTHDNSNVMTILPSGNVGIGTDSPDYILTTQGSGAQRLKVVATDPSQHSAGVYFLVKNGASQVGTGTIATQNNGDMDFYTGSTSESFKMTIEADGNVGIGVTSPSTKVHIEQNNLAGATVYNANYTQLTIENSGSAGIQINSATYGIIYFGDASSPISGQWLYVHSSDTYLWMTAAVTTMSLNATALTVKGDVIAYGTPSDKRLKENIKPIESALDKVSKLQGVTFDWKKQNPQDDKELTRNWKNDIGFIAQDVQKVIPELVRENEDGMLSMRHQGIAPILLEAIKELKAEIEELKLNKCNCNK